MQQPTLHLGQAVSTAWEALNRYPGLTIGGFLLYGVITGAASFVPFLNIAAQIALYPPMQGGLYILFLNMVDDGNPQIGDLFAGFRAFGKWMGIHWLFYAIAVAALIPGLLVVAAPLVFAPSPHGPLVPPRAVPAVAGAIVAAVLAYLAGVVWLLIRWAFVYLAGVERAGVLDAFRHSSQITSGRRLQLFWLMFVLGLLSFSGVLLLVLGLIITIPLAMLGQAALYRQLSPLPASQPEPPQAQAPAGEESLS